MQKIKTIFFGTPGFSVPFLKALINAPFLDVVAVVTEPDRPKGRGKVMSESHVAQFTDEILKPTSRQGGQVQDDRKIQLLKPSKIVNCKSKIENLRPEVAIVVAYGQIIPKDIIKLPEYGTINVHPSDLPKYRGPAPIQTALLNGDKQTAISVMKIDEKMDHGPILDKLPIKIDINDDYFSLEKKILDKGPQFLVKTLKKLLDSHRNARSKNICHDQDHTKATFTKMIKKDDGLIDWDKTPLQIHNKIRAYSQWPKAYTYLGTKRLNILKSSIVSGKLHLELVQLEGKKPVSWDNFMHGYRKIISSEILDKLG